MKLLSALLEVRECETEEDLRKVFDNDPLALRIIDDPENKQNVASVALTKTALRLGVSGDVMMRWMCPLLDHWHATGVIQEHFTDCVPQDVWMRDVLCVVYSAETSGAELHGHRLVRDPGYCIMGPLKSEAVTAGHHLRYHKGHLRYPTSSSKELVEGRHLDIIAAQGRPLRLSMCRVAAGCGAYAVQLLTTLRDPDTMGGRCPWNEETCRAAVMNGRYAVETITALRDPDTMGGYCGWGCFIVDYAVRNGQYAVKTIRTVMSLNGVTSVDYPEGRTCSAAAGCGKYAVEILTYLRNPTFLKPRQWEDEAPQIRYLEWDEEVCTAAAKNGQYAVATLTALRDPNTMGGVCPWDADVCSGAALNGPYAVAALTALRDPNTMGGKCEWDVGACSQAAKNGQWAVETLTALRDPLTMGGVCPWDNTNVCRMAARNGQWAVETITALRDPLTMGGMCDWDDLTCRRAARNGQWAVATLIALRDPLTMGGRCPVEVQRLCLTAVSNHPYAVATLTCVCDPTIMGVQCGEYIEGTLCAEAAQGGEYAIEVLTALRDPDTMGGRCPWNERTCAGAIWSGRHAIAVLTALRDPETMGGRCPWDEMTTDQAAEKMKRYSKVNLAALMDPDTMGGQCPNEFHYQSQWAIFDRNDEDYLEYGGADELDDE